MSLGRDTRGVSEVIGAILMFGLIVMLLAILQTQAIPAANEEVEYNHNDEVQSQLVGVHQAATETARLGDATSSKLEMGVRYPNRFLFFNPPSPAGELRTSDEETIRLENVQSPDTTVGKHMNDGTLTLSTRNLSYHGNYNEYRGAPTTSYEYGLLYNDYAESQLLVNDGGVIQGREISLLMPAGDLHETSGRAVSVDARPVSAPANAVPITGDGSGPPTLVLPSSMNTSLWEDAVDMSHVQSITENEDDGTVTIELSPDETYSLRMARIGVGDETPEQTPEYLYSQDGLRFDVPQGQSRTLNVEVRDAYNNPVSHEDVQFRIPNGSGAGSIDGEASSGSNGVASPRFDAPTEPQQVTVQATLNDSFSGFDASNERDLEFDIWVTSYAGGYGSSPDITLDGDPQIDCGGSGLGDFLDDPIDTIAGDNDITVGTSWTATHQDPETDIDTVNIKLIRQSNGQVVDTAPYAFDEETDGTQTVTEETALIDPEQCDNGNTYDIRAFVETTGSATDFDTEADVSSS